MGRIQPVFWGIVIVVAMIGLAASVVKVVTAEPCPKVQTSQLKHYM